MSGAIARSITASLMLGMQGTLVHATIDEQRCDEYSAFVGGAAEAKAPQVVAAFPDKLLADYTRAIPCLVRIIAKMGSEFSDDPPDALLTRFNLAAGALRTIITNHDTEAIPKIRSVDGLDFMVALSFAARSKDQNARANGLMVAANVVDNTTVCVPLDHLYSFTPPIDPLSYQANGRANLLAIVDVVAPWAYKENHDNISRAGRHVQNTLGDPAEFPGTVRLLANLENRLSGQPDRAAIPALPPELSQCKRYKPRWAAGELKY